MMPVKHTGFASGLFCLFFLLSNGLSAAPEWIAHPIANPAAAGSAVPRVVTSSSGRAYLTWIEPSAHGKAFRFIIWNQSHWSISKTIADGPDVLAATSSEPGLLALQSGLLVAQWLTQAREKEANHIVLSVSSDGGVTWSAPVRPYRDITPGEHMYVSLFPWPAGGAGIIWLDPRGGRTTALVQTSIDASGALGAEKILNPDVCSCCPTSSALTQDGPVIMFRGHTPEDIRDMRVSALVNGKWLPDHVVHADNWKINGCPTNSGSIATNGKDAAVVWFTGAGGKKRVSVAFSSDEGRSFREPLTIDDNSPSGRPALALLKDGSAMITWIATSPGNTGLRARQAWPDGRLGPTISLSQATASSKLGFPFVAAAPEGALVVWSDWDGTQSSGVHSLLLTH